MRGAVRRTLRGGHDGGRTRSGGHTGVATMVGGHDEEDTMGRPRWGDAMMRLDAAKWA